MGKYGEKTSQVYFLTSVLYRLQQHIKSWRNSVSMGKFHKHGKIPLARENFIRTEKFHNHGKVSWAWESVMRMEIFLKYEKCPCTWESPMSTKTSHGHGKVLLAEKSSLSIEKFNKPGNWTLFLRKSLGKFKVAATWLANRFDLLKESFEVKHGQSLHFQCWVSSY